MSSHSHEPSADQKVTGATNGDPSNASLEATNHHHGQGRSSGEESGPVDLLGFLKGLGHHWLAGLVTFVIVAGLLIGWALVAAPRDNIGTSSAHAHVLVSLPAPDSQAQAQLESSIVPQIMNNYLAPQSPDVLANAAAAKLHDGTAASDLKKACSTYWGGGGTVIAIYALGRDDDEAMKRADACAQAFVEHANDVVPPAITGMRSPTLSVIQKAFVSDPNPDPKVANASGSGSMRKLASPVTGIVAGIILGLVVMGILEYRDSRRAS